MLPIELSSLFPICIRFRPLSFQIFFIFSCLHRPRPAVQQHQAGFHEKPHRTRRSTRPQEGPACRRAQDRNPGITCDAGPGKTLFRPAYIDKVCSPTARASDAPGRLRAAQLDGSRRGPRRGPSQPPETPKTMSPAAGYRSDRSGLQR